MIDLPGGKLRMAATEVTNRQYEAFDPTHRRTFSTGDDDAVTMVSWNEARRYCIWLSQRTGRHFRLPTEAEWEWACRAGSATPYNTGERYPYPKAQANNRVKDTVSLRVAMFPPNAWGLYDMHGNVEEWCLDPWDEVGTMRVTRGGSHNMELRYLRSDARAAALADDRSVLRGFRVVEEVVDSSLADKPFFAEPKPYIVSPADTLTPFFSHNHQPSVIAVGNDLPAIWLARKPPTG
jgi:formylglycine-generating enzyme required for sulfatase activity